MTSRLLGRCARLLPRATPQASATTAFLPTPATGPAEPLWAQAWGQPVVKGLCDGRSSFKEEYPIEPKRTQLDELLERAQSPQDVLQAWAAQGGKANQAAKTLVQLVRLAGREKGGAKMDQFELLNDPRLLDIMDTVTAQVASVWNGTLVSLLRSLSTLGVPPTAAVQRSIQTEVLWRVRRLSYKQLAFLADWGAGRNGQMEVLLVSAALKQLELRWTEIADARTVSTLMARAGHLSPALMDRLEDKALELAEGFGAEDIRRVCVSLASQGRRSVPLLRALSYHFLQKPSTDLTTPLLLDLAYAYGKLNFHHSQVFQRLAAELLPRMPEISSADVTRCAKSLAFLKWLHLPLFEAFAEHYSVNSQKYSTLQLCNLLMSLARLNFQPSKGEEFYKKVHSALEGVLPSLEAFLQTDVVWSLCVLQQAKPHHITALTQHTHVAKLSEGSLSRVENYRLKLLHIIATLQLEHPESLSSTLPTEAMLLPSTLGRDSPLSPLQTGLKGALGNLVGGNSEALRTGVNTIYGWTIDGELVVDSENKPMDLVTLTAPHLPGGGGAKSLPEGACRLAFLTWEFPNYGSRSKDLLGRFTMMRRHLKLAGFILVEVPYYEWLELKSDWQKGAYVKDKMGKAIAEEMAK
ncbi:FAST kinase domain-containing protein 4 [Oncorhynchus mykiss]|uniref:FAST kinase domain-containing protein 4 n=1 Tax=Oncorhynchus mykiss TaxID=8022 RepID=A0A8C7QCW5_ONCMY|nr:FAST kinase domain-containing protein 4 [Oncorhynchus mykiss]XP_021412981.2 FAST kinase domain-containing protein 4 [Oncorhynchus mykiss]